MPGRERFVQEATCLFGVVGDQARHDELIRKCGAHPLEALGGALINERLPVEEQTVEVRRCERQRFPHGDDIESPPETSHRDLERMGTPVSLERDGLSVEDETFDSELTHRFHDLGASVADVVQPSSEDANFVARFVHLDTSAIELDFERGGTQRTQRVLDVVGGLGEHRLHRTKQLDLELSKPALTVCDRGSSDGAEVSGKHERSPNGGGGSIRRFGDAVHHDPFERSLTEIAHEKTTQEILLILGRFSEELTETLRTLARRTGPTDAIELFEGAIHLDELQSRRGGR